MNRLGILLAGFLIVLSACSRRGGEEGPTHGFTPVVETCEPQSVRITPPDAQPIPPPSSRCLNDDMRVMTCAGAHRSETTRQVGEAILRQIQYDCR